MQIKKFESGDFGGLTTITNIETGNTVFVAKEVAAMWGHKSFTQAISRLLNKDEFVKITRKNHPEIMREFVTTGLVTSKSNTIMLLKESGLYKLALASNLEKAKIFRDWVTSEVIPSIRKTGGYSVASWNLQDINKHTDIRIQKGNSKTINAKNYESGGIEKVIEYNRESCMLHTGLTPSEIKKIAKQKGLKSKDRSSAKEALRHLNPPVACGMSFTDNLTNQGFDLKTVSDLAKRAAIPLFEGMLELGAIPNELKPNKL